MILTHYAWYRTQRQRLGPRVPIALSIILFTLLAIAAEFAVGPDIYRPAREVTIASSAGRWMITAVHPVSTAYEAGLRPGDRFLEETDIAAHGGSEGAGLLERPGSVVIERDGQLHWFYLSDQTPSWTARGMLTLAALLFVIVSTFTWYRAEPSRASFTFLVLGIMASLTLLATPWATRGYSWALTVTRSAHLAH